MNEKKTPHPINAFTQQEEKEINILFDEAQKEYERQSVKITEKETSLAYKNLHAHKIRSERERNLSSGAKNSYIKYAAAAVILLGLISFSLIVSPHKITVPEGTTRSVSLSDGTDIRLNSGSAITYPRWFNIWDRTVKLNGEAFFEVAHTGDSFRVETQNAVVTVMGTAFNIRSWSNEKDNKTEVFLQEGKISFSATDNDQDPVILNPGEFSWLSEKQTVPSSPRKAELSKAVAWLHNGLAFEDQPLSAIFAEIGRRFNVQLKARDETLLRETLTIYISKLESAERTLNDICRAKNLEYTKNNNVFIITRSH